MNADPLPQDLSAFLRGETDSARFHHADHVRMAFEILCRHGAFLVAASAYARGLEGIAARAGNPGAYHETITIAFLSLIAERMAAGAYPNFTSFSTANADLLDSSALVRWYTPDRLRSAVARATFVLPYPRETSS